MQQGADRLVAIDGARGIASIMVMLTHGSPFFERLVAHGHLAVDLFFMLSGFVLACVYERRFADGLDAKTYMTRRLFRLYPMLFLGGVVGLIVFTFGLTEFRPTGRVDLALAIIGQVALIPFLTSSLSAFPLNGTHWSITYELFVNYCHIRLFNRLTTALLVVIVWLTGFITAATAYYHGDLDFGWQWPWFAGGIVRACFGFFAGVLIYRLKPGFGRGLGKAGMPVLAGLTVLVTLDPLGVGTNSNAAALYELALLFTVLPLICVLSTNVSGGSIARALGTLSYPLYALHGPVVFAVRLGEPSLQMEGMVYIVMIVLAYGAGRMIDEPINAWRHREDKRNVIASARAR